MVRLRSSSGPVITTASPLRVQVVVAGNAMHRGRRAGDQRHVVRAGEARHGAVGDGAEALVHEAGDVRDDAVADALLDVGGIAAVDADDDDGLLRPAVGDAVEVDCSGSSDALSSEAV